MNYKLLAKLEEAIEKFVNENCDDDEWPDTYWPDNGSKLVTQAASLIIDSFEAERVYIKDNTIS